MSFVRQALTLCTSLFLHEVSAVEDVSYLQFQMTDARDKPTQFRDGLPTYLHVSRYEDQESQVGLIAEEFLLCTSCTISYIFGTYVGSLTPFASTMMTFEDGKDQVQVDFYENQILWITDTRGNEYQWSMTIGYIDKDIYLNDQYGLYYEESMLGLAPFSSTDSYYLS